MVQLTILYTFVVKYTYVIQIISSKISIYEVTSILMIILFLTNYTMICKYKYDLKHNNLRNLKIMS